MDKIIKNQFYFVIDKKNFDIKNAHNVHKIRYGHFLLINLSNDDFCLFCFL